MRMRAAAHPCCPISAIEQLALFLEGFVTHKRGQDKPSIPCKYALIRQEINKAERSQFVERIPFPPSPN